MDVRERLVEMILSTDLSLSYSRESDALNIADVLITHGVTVQEWIPIEDEQKPKDRKSYFIAFVFGDSDMHFFGEAMYHAYEGNGLVDRPHFSNEGVSDMRVTHWMEKPKLPEPPKGE